VSIQFQRLQGNPGAAVSPGRGWLTATIGIILIKRVEFTHPYLQKYRSQMEPIFEAW
jgi:hypothetical protein